MKRKIIFFILVVFFTFSISGCSLSEAEDNEQIIEQASEIDNVEIFGEKENDIYYSNEKNIRQFVVDYNKFAVNKVHEVKWKNNHKIGYMYFDDESCKINDHTEQGFIITCEFKDGQAKVYDYESIFKDMIILSDNKVTEETIYNAFNSARNSTLTTTNITDNITIWYSYIKEKSAIKSADTYIIRLIIKQR